jgi:hypothetical protein
MSKQPGAGRQRNSGGRRPPDDLQEATVPFVILPSEREAPPTLYLGISGVLHPSESLYTLLHGRSPWDDGNAKYQSVPVLEAALQRWPDAEVVLTSTLPRAHGLATVLQQLGPSLAGRVVGCTQDDLTNRVKRTVSTRSGSTRTVGFSTDDYRRMNKAGIVATHVAWRRPVQWVAVDDEDILWPRDMRRDRLVLTDGGVGLASAEAQDRLLTVLLMNFGSS